jgi:hypothetical protein
MSSLTQIDTNRVNSQNSTGSISPGRKTASSLNAMKSGIHAGSRIIRGEDHPAMSVLCPSRSRYHPESTPLTSINGFVSYFAYLPGKRPR